MYISIYLYMILHIYIYIIEYTAIVMMCNSILQSLFVVVVVIFRKAKKKQNDIDFF